MTDQHKTLNEPEDVEGHRASSERTRSPLRVTTTSEATGGALAGVESAETDDDVEGHRASGLRQ
jgi:hypothetical protein